MELQPILLRNHIELYTIGSSVQAVSWLRIDFIRYPLSVLLYPDFDCWFKQDKPQITQRNAGNANVNMWAISWDSPLAQPNIFLKYLFVEIHCNREMKAVERFFCSDSRSIELQYDSKMFIA